MNTVLKNGWFLLGMIMATLIQGLYAQDETMRTFESAVGTYVNDTLWTNTGQPTLMLVPFEPMMYKSQVDRSIGGHDGTSYNQIVNNFRIGLDNLLFIEAEGKYRVIRMVAKDENRKKDLFSIYGKSGRDFRSIEPKTEEKKQKISLSQFKKKKVTEDKSINDGQLRASADHQEKMVARTFQDSSLFDYLHGKYESVLYVFINQFDIGPMRGLDYRAYESDEYQREIKVHYSIYTHKRELFSGIATTYFSSTVNSQKDIIVENMPNLAKQIIAKVPILVEKEK